MTGNCIITAKGTFAYIESEHVWRRVAINVVNGEYVFGPVVNMAELFPENALPILYRPDEQFRVE